jgi:hypothetical protein
VCVCVCVYIYIHSIFSVIICEAIGVLYIGVYRGLRNFECYSFV